MCIHRFLCTVYLDLHFRLVVRKNREKPEIILFNAGHMT